ncbi:MAG: class II aldolase/adducin family protein [Clostridiales bacterium]|nr:class II aldolase/adducin family protein [Clostridiales bacterium]
MPSMMTTEKFDGTITTADQARKMCVIGNRMLANDRVLDAFGHVTVRNPERPDTFFISWATSPAFVTLDDLQLCDFDGNILSDDKRRPYGERILHARIFKARPDVNAVCHGHPSSLIPFFCTDTPLRPLTAGGALFFEGVPLLKEWDPESGVHIATIAAGDSLAEALGNGRAALIRSHGMVTVGDCVQILCTVSNSLVGTAATQYTVLQLGAEPFYLSAGEAEKAVETSLGAIGIERSWNYKVKHIKEIFPDIKDLFD